MKSTVTVYLVAGILQSAIFFHLVRDGIAAQRPFTVVTKYLGHE